jgi:chromosome segregation ATPase
VQLTEERNDLKRKIEDAQQMLDEKDKELKSRQEAIGGQAAEIAKLERLWEGEKKKTGKLSEKLGEEKTAVAMLKSQVHH